MKNHIIRLLEVSILLLMPIVTAFSVNTTATAAENIPIYLEMKDDLKNDPDCDLQNKNDIRTRLFTIVERDKDNGRKYFCLDEGKEYPHPDNGYIPNDIEEANNSVRWLVHNYNKNKEFLENVNDVTAYGATQIAIWFYTSPNIVTMDSTYVKNNPIVIQLIEAAKEKAFPALKTTLDSYTAKMNKISDLVLKGDKYVAYFSINLSNKENKEYDFIKIKNEILKIMDRDKNIIENPGVELKELSEGNYELTVSKDLVRNINSLGVNYEVNLQGTTDVLLALTPLDGAFQKMGYTKEVTMNKSLAAAIPVYIKEAQGSIKVTKVDEKGTSLKGAEFSLTDQNGASVKAESDANGLASFDIEANKTYKLEETKNPQGYKGSFVKEGITLANDGQVFEYTATNIINKGSIKVTKVDEKGTSLKGAEFSLTDQNGASVKAESDANGLASFDIEANKTYKLEETKNPQGYKGSFVKEGITLANDGQVFEYTATNIINKGSIKVTKVDEKGTSLKGAEFSLTDQNGASVKAESDANGLASFDIEANKTYKLEETKNPQGYKGSFVKEGITLANDGQVFEYTVVNHRIPTPVKPNNSLPKAGEQDNLIYVIIGASIVLLISLILYGRSGGSGAKF